MVAPIPTTRGETVRRIGPRYTVTLFPFFLEVVTSGEPLAYPEDSKITTFFTFSFCNA